MDEAFPDVRPGPGPDLLQGGHGEPLVVEVCGDLVVLSLFIDEYVGRAHRARPSILIRVCGSRRQKGVLTTSFMRTRAIALSITSLLTGAFSVAFMSPVRIWPTCEPSVTYSRWRHA